MARCANKEKEVALSHSLLCSVLSYTPETGIFEWREKRGPNGKPHDAPTYVEDARHEIEAGRTHRRVLPRSSRHQTV
jgi:hypothetical protein